MRIALLAASAALFFAVSPALADDTDKWSGRSIGFYVGTEDDTYVSGRVLPVDGPLVGARLRYDAQAGNLVIGASIEAEYSSAEGEHRTEFQVCNESETSCSTAYQTETVGVNAGAAALVRAGYSVGDFLPYGMLGVEYKDIEHDYNYAYPDNTFGNTMSSPAVGVTYGLGVAWKPFERATLDLSYRHSNLEMMSNESEGWRYAEEFEIDGVRFGVEFPF